MGSSAAYLIALGKEEGLEEGTRETLLRNVRSLMLNSSYNTPEAALDILDIKNKKERQYVINSLTSYNVKK